MAVVDEYKSLIRDTGRAAANALFPNDFEYYAVSFELADSEDNTVDYLTFPVPPESIRVDSTQITNIKKTMGGLISITTPTYIPIKIILTGTFGRKLRILLGSGIDLTNVSGLRFSTNSGVYTKEQVSNKVGRKFSIFNPTIKTGYGVTKILQSIYDKSNSLDDKNQPFRLYFYNPTLGESYLVKVNNLVLEQDKTSSNMMWNYSIEMTTLAPLGQIKDGSLGSLIKTTGMNVVQSGVNSLAKGLINSL